MVIDSCPSSCSKSCTSRKRGKNSLTIKEAGRDRSVLLVGSASLSSSSSFSSGASHKNLASIVSTSVTTFCRIVLLILLSSAISNARRSRRFKRRASVERSRCNMAVACS